MPCSAGLESARRSASAAGAALWCIPRAELLCDVGEQNTTVTFLVLLMYGPRSIGVIRSTKWVFREEAVATSPSEGAKLSSLPTSSSCDKDGRHNLHNCTLTSALGIVIDIIVALGTLWSTAWDIVRDLEQHARNTSVAWPLPDGDPSRPAHVTLQTAATNEATTFFPQLAFARLSRGVPAPTHSPTLDRRQSKSHEYTATASPTVE